MEEIFNSRLWQYVKLGCGALLLVLGLFLPFLMESSESAKMADLETEGIIASATITKMEMSAVQAPRHSSVGTYMLMRGLGTSRKAAIGGTLIARSNARSAKRAAAASGYYDIEFELPQADGQVFLGADHLLIPRTDSLDVGSQITVLHDPHDPGIHRLPSYSKPSYHVPVVLKAGAAVLTLAFGALLLWAGLQSAGVATPASTTPLGREVLETRAVRAPVAPPRQGAAAPPIRRAGFGPAAAPKGFGPRARA